MELISINFYSLLFIMKGSVLEWLQCLGLDVYYETLQQQQYDTMDSVIEITWEDLEDMSINLLGESLEYMSVAPGGTRV